MTNTPSMVGEGATAYSLGKNVTQDEGKVVKRLFSGVGRECHPVHENLMDAVTGVSGSGPAYMYLIIGKIYPENILPKILNIKLYDFVKARILRHLHF